MQLFSCPSCGGTIYFQNSACSACGAALSFNAGQHGFVADGSPCANRDTIGCNWAAEKPDEELCHSCDMTEVIPDLAVQPNQILWSDGEIAKRWALVTLARWGWFGPDDTGQAPTFHFKAERTRVGKARVIMGHANGVITINIAEADDAIRVRNRQMLDEDYRTMLGHMRHEVAHFIFDRLSEEPGFLDQFRALFGDERADYGAALKHHYAKGPPAGWENAYVTPYASAHPHEDWAESAAHVMHLVDMVDSAVATGLTWPSKHVPPVDAYQSTDSFALFHSAVDLGLATNQLTRAMGLNDLYPFVLAGKVREKIEFVHSWLNRNAR